MDDILSRVGFGAATLGADHGLIKNAALSQSSSSESESFSGSRA